MGTIVAGAWLGVVVAVVIVDAAVAWVDVGAVSSAIGRITTTGLSFVTSS